MCAPKVPKAPEVAKALPGAEDTATFFKRDNGSKELTGEKAKARRSLSDLQVTMDKPTSPMTGLQV